MTPSSVRVRRWLVEPLPKDVAEAIDRVVAADDVRQVSVMPDVHLSRDVCTGLVVATRSRIFPDAVGSDIGCGMAAVRFRGDADVLAEESAAARLLAGLYRAVPAARQPDGRLPEALAQSPLSCPQLERLKHRDGRVQLGTLGRGNHFVELQRDDENALWLMVHSGSRAMGQAITDHHRRHAIVTKGLAYFDAESDAGRAYLNDMTWACAYADENRRAMIVHVAEFVAELFGFDLDGDTLITCNHNHVRHETHFGEPLWVHRKGALSAQDGEAAVIPGSMGTASFHVVGRGEPGSLCSSSHGAGRRMSRTEARRAIPGRDLQRQMGDIWFDHRIADALREESPAAYKDIRQVMKAQRDLTRIVREVRPVLVYKGT